MIGYNLISFSLSVYEQVIFLYTASIIVAYLAMWLISGYSLLQYKRKNSIADYDSILVAPFSPTISIIAPAFNESKTIIDNVRGLLTLSYSKYEIIIVNDGSTDGMLEKIVDYFEMRKVPYVYNMNIACQPIRAIYMSEHRADCNLYVIDKQNGGKADSLNAGLNLAHSKYVVNIDVDCIIERDALLKLVKPFLEEKEAKVIAVGGVVKIANSCEFEDGNIRQIRAPQSMIARFQALEYSRGLFMGRMAWAQLDGLLIISGALGMFDKDILVNSGGYRTDTVGEDMEIVVRIRKYMADNKQKYAVKFIPDPLCWTEVPENLRSLGRQRNRWTRGSIETLMSHSNIFMRPRYKKFGMLGYTYWVVFEWFAPIFEFLAFMIFVIQAIFFTANWSFLVISFFFIYTFAVALTSWSLLFEEVMYHSYTKKRDILKLIVAAFLEPICFHPLTVWWSLKGNFAYLRGEKKWGANERKGFDHHKHGHK
jgi:poly-beta-1,6-N-acetyl-D-glucosamine synthase